MRFNNYFNEWLYGKDGYYSKYHSIGKDGDFYTSVSTSKFFGGAIANKIIKTIKSGFLSKDTAIVEIGAHHGYLLADIIEFINTLEPKLIETLNFAIVERFENLQIQQQNYFKKEFGEAITIKHYDDISKLKLQEAFIVANEIFDAFPIDLVYTSNNILQSAFVDNHNIKFQTCKSEYLKRICNKYNISKGEVAIGYEEFAKNLATNITKFEFLTFDYGEKYPRNEFSIRVYCKHNVYPLFEENLQLEKLFKNSDITYDVNFAHLIDSFKEANIQNETYTTQSKVLVEFGIIDLLEILKNNCDENIYLREVQKVKILLEPTGMGDRFKVALFKKDNI